MDNLDKSEAFETLKVLVEGASKRVEVLRNPNLVRFLRSKGIAAFGPVEKLFAAGLLVSAITPERYDKRFQAHLKQNNLRYFTELVTLIEKGFQQDPQQARRIIDTFLRLEAIKSLQNLRGNVVSNILMDTMVTELEQKYKTTEKLDPHALQEELAMLADKVISKTEDLLKYPVDFEKVASELLSEIKNNYEVAKYIAGLILAFFDLSAKRLRKVESYFDPTKSVSKYYFHPRGRFPDQFWIQDYVQNSEQATEYGAIKTLFKDWLFKGLDKLRHFESHGQKDVKQEKLASGIYQVKLGSKEIEEYTYDGLKKMYDISYQFLLLTKFLIARKFFDKDPDLFGYLAAPYDYFEAEPRSELNPP